MWSKEEVIEFLEDNPIKTGGSIADYPIDIEEKDDGDVWFEVKLPFWSQNPCVVTSIIKLLNNLLAHRDYSIYARNNNIKISFYNHCCRGD